MARENHHSIYGQKRTEVSAYIIAVPEITLYIIFCISIAYAAMMCRELWVLNHSKTRAPRIVRSADNGKVR